MEKTWALWCLTLAWSHYCSARICLEGSMSYCCWFFQDMIRASFKRYVTIWTICHMFAHEVSAHLGTLPWNISCVSETLAFIVVFRIRRSSGSWAMERWCRAMARCSPDRGFALDLAVLATWPRFPLHDRRSRLATTIACGGPLDKIHENPWASMKIRTRRDALGDKESSTWEEVAMDGQGPNAGCYTDRSPGWIINWGAWLNFCNASHLRDKWYSKW